MLDHIWLDGKNRHCNVGYGDASEKKYSLRNSSKAIKSNLTIDESPRKKKEIKSKPICKKIKKEKKSLPFSVDEICKIKEVKTDGSLNGPKVEGLEQKDVYVKIEKMKVKSNIQMKEENEKKDISKLKKVMKDRRKLEYECECGKKYSSSTNLQRHRRGESMDQGVGLEKVPSSVSASVADEVCSDL
ncbi:hypothetical protein QAD02_022658 [Eretmocerus hayati]|uniref:Uncharacterized protein n=1 Tax=Eretmocerus hayati TaxID=131215 RepID=A0ACC2PU99_9HYME|nr:hypothetical protein QAD02_022658 [Eretmocerus hayati]